MNILFVLPVVLILLIRFCKKASLFKNLKSSKLLAAAFALFFTSSILTGCSIKEKSIPASGRSVKSSITQNNNSQNKGIIKIHYIDVGQGDSILVQQGNSNMLIDTGTNASTSDLLNYLKKQHIDKIDYLILTHPHEDHIGGADAVIKNYNIGKIYMPKKTANTKTFRDVVNAMKGKNLKASEPKPLESFKLGSADCMILGPVNPISNDLNTYSIVLKVTFGNSKFLFTGDTQSENEKAMIKKGYDLSADVLKVAHHGSHTSTCEAFLEKVNPSYAVISVGKGNDYGHPHEVTLKRLKAKNINILRTEESGTIICTSDGKNINFTKSK